MDYLRAFILGIIQAITEFLPISSSAHLILFREWLEFNSVDGLTFDVALHLGTAIALIAYFNRDLRSLVAGFVSSVRTRDLRTPEHRLPWYILAASVPAALAGALLGDFIEEVLRRPNVIVVTLIAGGALFLLVERISKNERMIRDLTFMGSMAIGIAQSLALVPGVSRSGITILTGMAQNLRREEAARFSFLLSVPVLLGASAKKALDLPGLVLSGPAILQLLIGVATAAVGGWIVIRFLLRFLQRHRLDLFAYYRFALAAVIVLWLAM